MMLKFCVQKAAVNCVESFTYLYPEKGHTHGPLDDTFRQTCAKLSLEELEDDTDAVGILDHFCSRPLGSMLALGREQRPTNRMRQRNGPSALRKFTWPCLP